MGARLLDSRRGIDVVTVAGKHVLQQQEDIRIVFDEEDAGHVMPVICERDEVRCEMRGKCARRGRHGHVIHCNEL